MEKKTLTWLDDFDPLKDPLPDFDLTLDAIARAIPDPLEGLDRWEFWKEGPRQGAGKEENMGNAARKQPPVVTVGAIGNTEGDQTPKILDLTEACAFLGIAKVTMYAYLKRGSVPAFKYPGSRVWKFDREKLEQWLKSQQEGAKA